MKGKKLVVVALSATVMAACSGNNDASVAKEESNGVNNFEISIVEKSLKGNYLCVGDTTFGTEVKLYTTAGATLQWPRQLGNADVKCLQDTLLARCFGSDTIAVDEAMRRFVAEPVTMDDDAELQAVDSVPTNLAVARVLEQMIDVRAMSLNSRYATFEVYHYMYGGGAHPVYSSSFVNYDVQRGKVLGIGDIVMPDKTDDLATLIKSSLRERFGVTTDKQLQDKSGINVEAIDYALQSPTFYLEGCNVVFYFNPYEIGPWAIGAVEVPVPVYALDGIMLPEVGKLLGCQ